MESNSGAAIIMLSAVVLYNTVPIVLLLIVALWIYSVMAQ